MKKYFLLIFLLISLAGLIGCCGLFAKSLIEPKLTPADLERMVREGQKEKLQKEIEKGRVFKTPFGYYLNPCYTSPADYNKIACEALKDEAKMLKYGIPILGHALSFKRVVEYFLFEEPEKNK